MRIVWNNGVWKVFDTFRYRDEATFDLYNDAVRYLSK